MGKLVDLTGQRFGRWTALSRVCNENKGESKWLCRCDCGTEKKVRTQSLINGRSKSCGCATHVPDPTGQRFGNLMIIKRTEKAADGTRKLLCKCDCGNEFEAREQNVLHGRTKSCGCQRHKGVNVVAITAMHKKNTIHGGKGTRLYRIWCRMKARCYNRNTKDFIHYGGRGITICDEWQHDFATFRDWAISHGYADNLSIDRINVDGNYCPENCRWATAKEQRANQRQKLK